MAGTMVSRRKILSRSKDNLNVDNDEEDVWFQKDKLFKEHIQEVLDKWTQIDDEIWAKIIVFERNRRVAKAYARVPVLTINGSDDGFDGMRIGLSGFDNPLRDAKTAELKNQINQGIKVKMDDAGNILVRRYSKSNVFIKSTSSSAEESAIGMDVMKLPNQSLEIEKVYKIFDMKKFQSNVNRELSRAYPDRRRLETQCLSIISFVKSENDLLECPIWVMIVNVVAMDMLKSKIPPVHRPIDIKNRPKIPIPDEDPYSDPIGSASASSSNSSGPLGESADGVLVSLKNQGLNKPPKLPPRESSYSHVTKFGIGNMGKSEKGKDSKKYEDPYYCGLSARVPNFAKQGLKPSKEKKGLFSSKADKKQVDREVQGQRASTVQMPHPASFSTLYQLHQQNKMFDANSKKATFQRQYSQPENFNVWPATDTPYSVYGRLGANRGHVIGNAQRPTSRVFVGEWE